MSVYAFLLFFFSLTAVRVHGPSTRILHSQVAAQYSIVLYIVRIRRYLKIITTRKYFCVIITIFYHSEIFIFLDKIVILNSVCAEYVTEISLCEKIQYPGTNRFIFIFLFIYLLFSYL